MSLNAVIIGQLPAQRRSRLGERQPAAAQVYRSQPMTPAGEGSILHDSWAISDRPLTKNALRVEWDQELPLGLLNGASTLYHSIMSAVLWADIAPPKEGVVTLPLTPKLQLCFAP